MKIKCPDCRGECYKWVEEGKRQVQEACCHCGTEGFISEETYLADRMLAMCNLLACDVVERHKRLENSQEDREGWAFQAAESGMAEHEYTLVQVMQEQDRLGELFQNLEHEGHHHELVMSLLDRLAPEDEELFVRERTPSIPPDDDIPF